jgi:hypothetical protein
MPRTSLSLKQPRARPSPLPPPPCDSPSAMAAAPITPTTAARPEAPPRWSRCGVQHRLAGDHEAVQQRAFEETPRDFSIPPLPNASVRPAPPAGAKRTVTTRADACGERRGTRTTRSARCLWKAALINAQDAKAGARHAQRVTNVMDELAFKESSAGFLPPARITTSKAEESIDMAILIHELDGLRSRLRENPAARLAWATDTTPGLGREISAVSVMASSLTWGEEQDDGLPSACVEVDRVVLPICCAVSKDAAEMTILLARAMQLVATPWEQLFHPSFCWVDAHDNPLENPYPHWWLKPGTGGVMLTES